MTALPRPTEVERHFERGRPWHPHCSALLLLAGTTQSFAADSDALAPEPSADEPTVLQARCDDGVAAGCTALGLAYDDGSGVTANLGRATELYEQGCEGGNAAGCTSLGFMCADGLGVAADPARAMTLHERSCEAGERSGCANAILLARALEGDASGRSSR